MATPGQLFSVYSAPSGYEIKGAGSVPNKTTEMWVRNDLGTGAISACVYRSGKLLATKTGITPGQTAAFQFKPAIYVGVASQWDVKPGQILNSAIMSAANTQFSLVGLTGAATIVMSGGGPGQASTPFTFTLQAGS